MQEKTREQLMDLLVADNLSPQKRIEAGHALALRGDPRDFDELVTIPAGPFIMGADEAGFDEKPQTGVVLPAYKIGRYPVTNAQYRQFADATGEHWQDKGFSLQKATHPAVWVRWHSAVAYCRWLTGEWQKAGKITANEIVRLPSEAEWEKAARGTDGRIYPWGNEPDPNRANYDDSGLGGTSPVGCFPGGRSVYGCEDMAGNVWEWCSTIYREFYPFRLKDEWTDDYLSASEDRVLRGGSFENDKYCIRCASRAGGEYDSGNRGQCYGSYQGGFRIVVVRI